MQKNLTHPYLRILTYLGDTQAPGMIRVILPYMVINAYNRSILTTYDFLIHRDIYYYHNLPILQFQRSCTEQQFQLIKNIKENIQPKTGTKIFYDIDDLITDIPIFNQARPYYERYRSSIIDIFKTVDCIICSTPELSRIYNQYNKTKIIKNRLVKPLWGEAQELASNNINRNRKKILWAGSATHFNKDDEQGDFNIEILNFIKETTKEYEWVFMGAIPTPLKDNKEITFYPWITNYFEYISFLKELKPDIGIALLENNKFNKCKSNIKALEYTALGIPGVYSNIIPYNGLYCNIKTPEQFKKQITLLSEDIDYRKLVFKHDKNYLKNELYWDEKYIKKYLDTYLQK